MANGSDCPFTTSMKPFDDDGDDVANCDETFYAIDGPTLVFNSKLVDSVTVLGYGNANSVSVRMNNRDGTNLDKTFLVSETGISEMPVLVTPGLVSASMHAG